MPATPGPLPPDVVDELLSAELDGELDAAARDHDLTVDEAHAALAGTPGIDARRAALARARAVSAGDAVALDALTRERLVRGAHPRDVLPARAPRSGAWPRVLAVAASIVVVAAVAALAFQTKGSDNKASKSSVTTFGAAALTPDGEHSPSLGRITSDQDLERIVERLTPAPASHPSGGATTTVGGNTDTTGPAPTQGRRGAGSQCLATLPGPSSLEPASVHLAGYATDGNAVLAVAIGAAGSDPVAWAYDPTTCRVVFSSFGRPR
jgi:hypothetical protein